MKPIISPQTRIRHPELFEVGPFSIVDDFSYFSTKVKMGLCSHIAANCTVGGGADYLFSIGDFCSVSSGVRIWCTSDDFVNDLVTILPPGAPNVKKNLLRGNVSMANFTAIGANTVVLPKNAIPEGTVIGALSFVPYEFKFEPWTVYAGNPVRKIKSRNKSQVLAQAEALYKFLEKKAA